MSVGGIVEFKAIRAGVRPEVRVSAGGVTYEKRYANWITWTLVVITGGTAAIGWPWILFGRRAVTVPRGVIQSVEVKRGPSWATLIVRSTTETVSFRTNVAIAEQARNVLLSAE